MTPDPHLDPPALPLGYRRVHPVRRKRNMLPWKILGITVLLLFFAGLLLEHLFALPAAGSLLELCAGVSLFCGFIIIRTCEVMIRPRYDDETDEQDWRDYQEAKKRIIAHADTHYANGPIGTWGYLKSRSLNRGAVTVSEKRSISFEPDGKGRFVWFKEGDHPIRAETIFEFRSDGPGILSVRAISPEMPQWARVSFGFDASRDSEGDPSLVIWFEGKNAMPLDFKEFWPFVGTFRQPEP